MLDAARMIRSEEWMARRKTHRNFLAGVLAGFWLCFFLLELVRSFGG